MAVYRCHTRVHEQHNRAQSCSDTWHATARLATCARALASALAVPLSTESLAPGGPTELILISRE